MIVFWGIASCRRHRPDDGGSASETSVYYNETTRRYISERYHLQKIFLPLLMETEATQQTYTGLRRFQNSIEYTVNRHLSVYIQNT
jgi:hypothetical protein